MNMHLPVPRLMPFTVLALAATFAMKTADLARHTADVLRTASAGSVVSATAASMVTEARAAVPEKAPPATPVPSTPATVGPDGADQAPISSGERAVLLDLRQRRQELDARDAAIAARESVLAAAEQKLAARADELTVLQKKLQDLEDAHRQREEAGWQGLVKLYESMKPRDAATIFNDLQMPVLLALVDRMKEQKAAPILAAMLPDKARDVTAGLAKARTHGETPRGVQGG